MCRSMQSSGMTGGLPREAVNGPVDTPRGSRYTSAASPRFAARVWGGDRRHDDAADTPPTVESGPMLGAGGRVGRGRLGAVYDHSSHRDLGGERYAYP